MRGIINSLIPFHLQSSNFGMSIKDLPSIKDEFIPHVDSHQNILKYRVPRYYKRLLWYDVFENEHDGKKNVFRLNDEGKKHVLERVEDTVSFEKHKLEFVTLNANLSSIDAGVIPFLQEKGYMFRDVCDLVDYIGQLSLNLDVLSIYSSIFRGRYCTYGLDIPLNSSWVLNHYKEIVVDSLYGVSNMDFGEICKDKDLVNMLKLSVWDNHPFFVVYEDALRLIEMVYLYHKDASAKADALLEKKVRKARQYYSLIHFT